MKIICLAIMFAGCRYTIANNVDGLLLCRYFIMSSTEPRLNKVADDEVNNKCSIGIRLPDIS
jgi:hypothetical protein